MRSIRVVAGVAGHVVLVAAAVVTVLVATAEAGYPRPLRVALVMLVAVLAAVTLYGRFPLGLGPVAGSGTARTARMVGIALAGAGAAGVVLGFAQGGSPAERASVEVPQYMVVLALYLAAFLAVTRRDSGLPGRSLLTSVGFGLLAAALFTAAVLVLPPGLIWLALLLIAGAAVGAAGLTGPPESRILDALLATVTACQALFFAAVLLFQYGPDAWMPYAGPGPLTPQDQLEQNRAEAIDPYVGPLLLGALVAIILIGIVLTARLRARTATVSPAAT